MSHKTILLLRGLPGSGKSTLANTLSQGRWPVYSVDDYFTNAQGEYVFNHHDNHLAYSACINHADAAMKNGIEFVIIDNTFTLEWEMEPYFELAKKHQYRLHCVTVENRHHGENTHGIPHEHIQRMAVKYKVVLC